MRSNYTHGAALCGAGGIMRVYHPGFRALIQSDLTFLSNDPDTAVAETIARMAQYAREDSSSPQILRMAAQLRGATDQETITRTWNWIRARVRFVSDRDIAAPVSDSPSISEVLIRPVDLIRMVDAQEDCDGFSMLGAALFLAMGVPVSFVTLAADPQAPDQYSHVYLEVAGAPFDSSHGPYLGWEARNRFGKRQLWSVDTGMPITRGGLRGLGQDEGGSVDLSSGFAFASPTGGGGTTPASPDFFQTLVTQGTGAALAILKARYAVPPPGTFIQTAGGIISTGGMPAPGVAVGPGSILTAGAIPIWVWVGGGLLLFLLVKGKK